MACTPPPPTSSTFAISAPIRSFEPGEIYPERAVNLTIGKVHADFAALRRYLVDDGFLERREGFYWRAGGSFDL